jgi:hypothetical protein
LCGNETFFSEAKQTVQYHSRIITNQYKVKIIHHFVKKVYTRGKEHDQARQKSLEMIAIFIEKIYKERSEMR